MSVVSGREITEYVREVHAALADLSPEVRRDLLEDLPEHLAEVGAEAHGSLTERLGPPEAYAAELRAAAGLAGPNERRRLDDRAADLVRAGRVRLAALDVATGPLLGYARTSEFLRLLRPAWWVLRGYLAVLALALLGAGQVGVLPRVGGSSLAAVPLLVLAVLGSIWLGRRGETLPRNLRRVMTAVGVLVTLIGMAALLGVDSRASSEGYYTPSYSDNPYGTVQDVFVYDRDGRLVDGARLFDQDGRPIELGYRYQESCPGASGDGTGNGDGNGVDETAARYTYVYPFCRERAPFRGLGGDPTTTPDRASSPTPGRTAPTATPPPSATPPDAEAPTPSDAEPSPPSGGASPEVTSS